jgi:hypothetical protein
MNCFLHQSEIARILSSLCSSDPLHCVLVLGANAPNETERDTKTIFDVFNDDDKEEDQTKEVEKDTPTTGN